MADVGDEHQIGARGVKAAVLTVRFSTELILLGVLAYLGANATGNLMARIALAVALPVLAAAIWGSGLAPRAKRRLPDPWRLGVESVLFLATAAGLALKGDAALAAIFAILTIGTAIAVRLVAPGS